MAEIEKPRFRPHSTPGPDIKKRPCQRKEEAASNTALNKRIVQPFPSAGKQNPEKQGDGLPKDTNYLAELHKTAQQAVRLGYSVIPVLGDMQPDKPKAAAVEWREFQTRRPTAKELSYWFEEKGFGGLAILTGSASGNLLVAEMDDLQRQIDFEQKFPAFLTTHTVKSGIRGLNHYYFSAPSGAARLLPGTRRVNGAELRFSGAYVIAAPTQISGGSWQHVAGEWLQPKTLTIDQLAALVDWIEGSAPAQPLRKSLVRASTISPAGPTLNQASELRPPRKMPVERTKTGIGRRKISRSALIAGYKRKSQDGRNNALFDCALAARWAGWTPAQTTAALADLHIVTAPTKPHRPESLRQRQRETAATIRSAYDPRRIENPPATRTGYSSREMKGLDNSSREELFRRRLFSAARILDGLILSQWAAGRIFTEEEAYAELAPFGIALHAVRVALKSFFIPFGFYLFREEEGPTKPTAEDKKHASHDTSTKAVLNHYWRDVRRRRGRPAILYRMPSRIKICASLGVSRSVKDRLNRVGDLESNKAYRAALHREFIRRCPGVYPRYFLSARLGVCNRTTQRYDVLIGVRCIARYDSFRVNWKTLEKVPEEREHAPTTGAVLTTTTGGRYPPVRAIAAKLLAQRETVFYQWRRPNFYELADSPTVQPAQLVAAPSNLITVKCQTCGQVKAVDYRTAQLAYWNCSSCGRTNFENATTNKRSKKRRKK